MVVKFTKWVDHGERCKWLHDYNYSACENKMCMQCWWKHHIRGIKWGLNDHVSKLLVREFNSKWLLGCNHVTLANETMLCVIGGFQQRKNCGTQRWWFSILWDCCLSWVKQHNANVAAVDRERFICRHVGPYAWHRMTECKDMHLHCMVLTAHTMTFTILAQQWRMVTHQLMVTTMVCCWLLQRRFTADYLLL